MMKEKAKRGSRRRPVIFLFFWVVGWLVAIFLNTPIAQFIENLTGKYWSVYPLGFLVSIAGFAVLQRHLLRRYLQLRAHSWVRWTLLGVLVSYVCFTAFDAVSVAPLDLSDFPDISEDFRRNANIRYALHFSFEYFLVLGIPILFQIPAMPRFVARRWLLIVSAITTGPLMYMSWEGVLLDKTWLLLNSIFGREVAAQLIGSLGLVEAIAMPMIIPGIVMVWLSRQAIRREDDARLGDQKSKSDASSSTNEL